MSNTAEVWQELWVDDFENAGAHRLDAWVWDCASKSSLTGQDKPKEFSVRAYQPVCAAIHRTRIGSFGAAFGRRSKGSTERRKNWMTSFNLTTTRPAIPKENILLIEGT